MQKMGVETPLPRNVPFIKDQKGIEHGFGQTLMERKQNREGFLIKANQTICMVIRPDLYTQS